MAEKSKKDILKQLTATLSEIARDDNGCDYLAIVDMSPAVDSSQSIRAESATREGRVLRRSEVTTFIRAQKAAYAKAPFRERGAEAEHAFLLVGTPVDDVFILFASEDPGEYQNLKIMSTLVRSRIANLLSSLAS